MGVGVLVQPYIVLPRSRGQFCPSWPHSLLAHKTFHYSQWGLRNKTLTSAASFTSRSRSPPVPPPPPTSTMSTSDDAGYSGRLRSSTCPIQEAQGEGRERSRSRDSRRGGRRDENLDDDSDSNTNQLQGTPTDRLDSPVHEGEAEKPLPGAGISRR